MPNPRIVELENDIIAKTGQLEEIFSEAGEDLDLSKAKGLEGDASARVDQVRQRNTELTELNSKLHDLRMVQDVKDKLSPATPAQQPIIPAQSKAQDLGQAVVNSKEWRQAKRDGRMFQWQAKMDMKALFSATTISGTVGFPPETTRTGDLVMYATRPLQLLDRIRQVPTSQSAVVYMEQHVRTSAAQEVGESLAYSESGLSFRELTTPVRKIGTFIPATDEQLEDAEVAEDLLRNDLVMMLKQRLDTQIQVGNGTGVNLKGILGYTAGPNSEAAPTAGNIGLINRGSNPHPDAIFKAITRCILYGRAMPDMVVIHPLDWETIRLTTTADGQYLWGSPALQGVMTIHGLPIVQSDSISQGDAIVGDFGTHCILHDRRSVDVGNVISTNSHDEDFIKGIITYRADLRCALQIRRPSAFWKVDFNA